MPVAYDRPGGGSTTRAPKRKPTLYAPQIRKPKPAPAPRRKAPLYAPQLRKGPSSSAAVTHVPGLGAVTRPTPRMHQAARSVAKAPARKAAKAVTHVPGLGAVTRPKPKQTAAQRERGAFTKHPVQGMHGAEHRAIGALGALHASNPDKYDTALAKASLAERAMAGPRGQTIEHFKGRTIGEALTDRPVKKLPPKRKITVAGFRGQTKPQTVEAGLGGELLKTAIQNAPKNLGDIATGMPTSMIYAAAHPVQAVKDTAKEYKDIATNPEKAIAERPVSTALAVSGVARAPGLAAGRILRGHRSFRARRAGTTPVSNARPHAGLAGTTLKEPRKPSRGVYSRGKQRQADAQHGPGQMTAREVQRQDDEHYDLTQRHAQRARDKAARRARAQGLSPEDTAVRVQEAGQGAQRGMDSVFARRFGANQRPSVGKRETEHTKAEREHTKTVKEQARQAKEHAKGEVAARKAERGTPSAHQTYLEQQRAEAMAELVHLEREHLSAQVSHERARGNARVSTARRKTSPMLADLHGRLKRAVKEDAVIGGDGPRVPKGATAPGPKPRNVSQEVRDARQAVSEADRAVNTVTVKGNERVAYHRQAETQAQRAVDSIAAQIRREEETASRLEGESTGRFKSGKMTAALGRQITAQADKLGGLRGALTDARRVLDDAQARTRSTHDTEIGHARQQATQAREHLTAKEAEERTVKASTLAGLRGQIAAENRRLAGVGPEHADALMGAIDTLDASATAKHVGRQTIRDLGEQIRLERAATRVNQRAAVHAAESDRQTAMAEFVARRSEHAAAKAHDIATKDTAATAPLTGANKQGRIFEHRYDATKVAERLNEAGHTVDLSNAKVRSPARFAYTDEGVRAQRSGDATVPVEYTVIDVPGGRFAVVPHLASEQKRLHGVVGTSKATNAMLLRDTRRGLTRAVLPFSAKWLGGQAGEAGLRALVEGAGPLDWLRHKRTVARMNEIEPGAGDEYMMRLPGTHFDVTGEARQALNSPTLAERYKGRWPEQPMAALTAAGQTLPGRLAKQGFAKWNEVVLGGINNAIERGAISAMTGHVIKRDLMNDRFLGLTQGAIDDAAHGLMDTPRQIAASRAAADSYGKYSNFSPEMRSAITHWTPFLPWYINTLRFLKNTVRDHPVKTSLAVSLNSATEEWRKQHGLSIYSDSQVPDWQLGSYPIFGDKLSRVGQFTPFGAFSDPVGALGGLGLPQATSAFLATRGVDWTGKPLRDSATGLPFNKRQRALKTAVSLGESMIPLASQGLRWSGVGARYVDHKDPQSIVPWRSRLARELPLWPLGDVGGASGGGGGGGTDAGSGVDIPPIDVPTIDIPPVDVGG